MNTVYVLGAGASAAAARDDKHVLTDDFLRVAFEMGRLDDTVEFYQRAFRHIRQLPVYDPHLYWLRGRVETLSGTFDSAREAIALGQEAARRLKNPWMEERLNQAAAELEKAAAGTPAEVT